MYSCFNSFIIALQLFHSFSGLAPLIYLFTTWVLIFFFVSLSYVATTVRQPRSCQNHEWAFQSCWAYVRHPQLVPPLSQQLIIILMDIPAPLDGRAQKGSSMQRMQRCPETLFCVSLKCCSEGWVIRVEVSLRYCCSMVSFDNCPAAHRSCRQLHQRLAPTLAQKYSKYERGADVWLFLWSRQAEKC